MIDFETLVSLMQADADPKCEVYLDLETGRTLALAKKVLRAMDDDDYQMLNHLPDKLRDDVGPAAAVNNHPERYVQVPEVSPADVLGYMRAFAGQQSAGPISDALGAALDGRGAFRRFRALLLSHPTVAAEWQEFKREAILAKAMAWLSELGIARDENDYTHQH